jgi:UrcA family protein
MTHLKLALAALAAAASVAPAAIAAPVSNGEIRIETADLNLNSAADANRLVARIREAAVRICNDHNSAIRYQDCSNQIVADTVAKLQIPALGLAYRDIYKDEPRLASR